MPATTEGALEALNSALTSEGGPPPASTTNADDDAGADGGGEQGGAAGADGGAAAGGDGDGAPAGAAAQGGAGGEPAAGEVDDKGKPKAAAANGTDPEADRGDGRNARGEFVKQPDETDEAFEKRKATPDPKAAKPEVDASGKPKPAAAKKPDHVNDPIPDDVQGRTRTRMEGLVAAAKSLTTERDTFKAENAQLREFVTAVEETGATPEVFGRHMEVLRLLHSPEVADKRSALSYLRKAADKIAGELGETPPGKDPLEGHQDLIDEVDAGEIKRERAIEIAQQRNRSKAESHLTEEQRRTQERDQQQRETADRVRAELNALTDEFKKKDGAALYARKHAILVPIVQSLKTTIKPEEMVKAVRNAYANIKLEPAGVVRVGDEGRGRVPGGTGNAQPARARQGAGGGGPRAPSSPLEALDLGLAEEAATRGR